MTANAQDISERSIFLTALEQNSPAERETFLKSACGDDASLRRRVEALLRSHENAASFFGKLAPERIAEELAAGQTADAHHDATHLPGLGVNVLHFLAPSAKPGSLGRLGTYEVEEVIGSGGMGIVLRAFDEKLHRSVAIKVMSAALATNEHARRRFVREGRAAAAVRDDHVIGIHGVDEFNGLPFLVMEYIVGRSLAQRLEADGPLPVTDILRIGGQIARGLAAAHAQGVVHRDIKPANILLENGIERVKITDFGLAHAVDDVRTTQPGTVVGTPEYMSPEQARGERVDHRSDLFSLGCVLYAMCAGRPPFRAESTVAIIRRVCEDTPRPLSEINADVPGWLTDLIDKLIAKDPADRFQTACEVAELLGQYLAHLQQPASAPLPVGWDKSRPAGTPAHRQVPGFGRRPNPALRRHLPLAAAIILLIGVSLALAETTGVTNLAATVIRIVRGDGILVVEVDDPNIQVMIDGEELVINGAGPKEIRLRPGQHELHAVKDGKPVDTKLVTITRDGREVVKVAHEAKTSSSAGPSSRVVWANAAAHPNSTTVSPDGRYLAFVNWNIGDLTIRDLATGKDRLLTNKGPWTESHMYADGPQFSADGTQLAYTWTDDDTNYDLRVIGVDGGESRILYSNKKDGVYPQACGWTPDGKAILVKLNLGGEPSDTTAATPSGRRRSQLVLLATKDASIRTIKTFEFQRGSGERGRRYFLAPDGRTIAYSGIADAASGQREIFLLDVETGVETQVTTHAAEKSVLAWTPDGRHLLFSMQRQGAQDGWLIRVVDGKPRGEAQLAKKDIGQIEPVGLTRAGALYYGTLVREPNLFTATLGWEKGTAAVTPLAAEKFNIQSTFRLGDWSPDGEHLAYWAEARRPRAPEMKIVSMKTSATRVLRPELSLQDPNIYFRWSPDGRSFIATGNSLKATSVIYQIDALSGQATKVVEHGGTGEPGWNRLSWSQDGQGIFYLAKKPNTPDEETLRLVYRNLQTQTERDVLPPGHPLVKRSIALEPSPDGRQLALLGKPTAESMSLSLLPVNGNSPQELFRWNTPQTYPDCLAWTPDGRFLIFTCRKDNQAPREIWYVSAAGGQPQKFTLTEARKNYIIARFRMHPDGKQLAISYQEGENRELCVLENFLPPFADSAAAKIKAAAAK